MFNISKKLLYWFHAPNELKERLKVISCVPYAAAAISLALTFQSVCYKEKRLYSEGRGRVKLHQRWFGEDDASCISCKKRGRLISLALYNASAAKESLCQL